MANCDSGNVRRHWGTRALNEKYARESAKRREELQSLIESQTVKNGITYTRLKPKPALSAETVELWRQYNL